jgi:hypothetical protein
MNLNNLIINQAPMDFRASFLFTGRSLPSVWPSGDRGDRPL